MPIVWSSVAMETKRRLHAEVGTCYEYLPVVCVSMSSTFVLFFQLFEVWVFRVPFTILTDSPPPAIASTGRITVSHQLPLKIMEQYNSDCMSHATPGHYLLAIPWRCQIGTCTLISLKGKYCITWLQGSMAAALLLQWFAMLPVHSR